MSKKLITLVLLISVLLIGQYIYSLHSFSNVNNWKTIVSNYVEYCVPDDYWFSCLDEKDVLEIINEIEDDRFVELVSKSDLDIFELLYLLKSSASSWDILFVLQEKGYKFSDEIFGCTIVDLSVIIRDHTFVKFINSFETYNMPSGCDTRRLEEYYTS